MTEAKAWQRFSPTRVLTAVALGVSTLVLVRIHREGVPPYGSDGAEYIEHAARLSILEHLRNVGWGSPWDTFVGADGAFPPFLHVATSLIGGVLGHSAGSAAATGVLWLLLLALAVGLATSELTGRRSVGMAAATACLLLPAAHGFATRYYYDLPMTALLWSSAALFLRTRQRAPVLGGLASGALFAAACLTKWPALAFGLPMILGALLAAGSDGRPRWLRRNLCLGVGAILVTLILASFLHGRGDDTSLAHMSRAALDENPPHAWTEQWEGPVGLVVQGVSARVRSLGAIDLAFYPLRAVTSVFSPLLALVLGLLLFRWVKVGRVGWRFVLSILVGHALFLVGLVPVLDDRFLLIGAPALIVAGATAWSGLPPQARRLTTVAVLALGFTTALDFHVGPSMFWNAPAELVGPVRDDFPCTGLRGLGTASSVEHRGWSRHDELGLSEEDLSEHSGCLEPRPGPRAAFRDQAWEAISGCRPSVVGVVLEQPMISPGGDKEWLHYRSQLARLEGGAARIEVVPLCPAEGQVLPPGPEAELLPVAVQEGAPPELPACLDPTGWALARSLSDPDGGTGLALFRRLGTTACGD